MSKSRISYYIVDFTASRKYFHQYPLIIGLSNFLNENGYSPQILMPITADRGDLSLAKGTTKFVLDSGYSSRSYKLGRYLVYKILQLLSTDNNSFLYIKSYFRKQYIKSAISEFELSDDLQETRIIFPNFDPLSLELALEISKISKMKNVKFYFRIVGSESRGLLSSGLELKKLLELALAFPSNIRIGLETPGYKTYLINLGFPMSSLSWSPWPCLKAPKSMISKNSKIRIGFLGCAKKRKGFDNIPIILKNLIKREIEFDVVIQESNFPWPEYARSKQYIKQTMGTNCHFLSSDLSVTELQNAISSCNLLILPYSATSYSINASGIVYHACDANVPVLTSKGVGFESEIIQFGLGLIYDNLDDIPKIVKKTNTVKFGFRDYNAKRLTASYKFLISDNDNS